MPGQIAEGGIFSKLWVHSFELASAVACALIGINYLVDSQAGVRSSIGQNLHPFDRVWTTMYVVAMPMIIYGVFSKSQNFRVAGLLMLGTGLFMNFIAALAYKPFEPRDFVFLCYSVACFLRGLVAADTVKPIPALTRWRSRGTRR
jgi:hypothetical protein